MSDTKENDGAGQGVPSLVEENQQLVDAEVQVKPEAASASVPVKETSNHVENGKAEQPAEDKNMKLEAVSEAMPQQDVENGKAKHLAEDKNVKLQVVSEEIPQQDVENGKAEHPAEDKNVELEAVSVGIQRQEVENGKAEQPTEDKNVKPEAVSEGIPQQDGQSTLHSVPMECDAQIINRTDFEEASDTKMGAEEFPESNKHIDNDVNVGQNSVDDAETAAEVKPEACGVADSKTCSNVDSIPSNHNENSVDGSETAVAMKPEASGVANSKTCNNDESIPSNHNEPSTSQPAPAVTKAEIKNVSEVENKADEKKVAEDADNVNSSSRHLLFLDPDHSYDGNESGTDEEQAAFMKELENFFRERSMEFKPPKFYGEGLNCLK